ncbi:MAG: hypothetical protein AAFR78_08510 [Planctomycetota bacterium]
MAKEALLASTRVIPRAAAKSRCRIGSAATTLCTPRTSCRGAVQRCEM